MFDKGGVFLVLLLFRIGIEFTVVAIALVLNLRLMRNQDADWRVFCSWVSLAVFSTTVIANALWDKGPISARHLWELSVFNVTAFGLAFVLSLVGRGLGRVFIAITSAGFCWLYFDGVHHP